jgi:hypothetical protein
VLAQLQTQHVEAEQRVAALAQEKGRLLQRVQEAEAQLEALLAAERGGNLCDRSSQTQWEGGEREGEEEAKREGRGPGRTVSAAAPVTAQQGRYYSPPPYPLPPHQQHRHWQQEQEPPSLPSEQVMGGGDGQLPRGNASTSLDSVVRKLRMMAEQLNQDE